MARMPTLLELMQMDRNRSQAGAMGDFFNAVRMPMAAQPAAPAPQPARSPAAAPMPAQAPAPAPERRGLLGGFFGPEGRDARARLAIALEGMTLNPNEALIGELQSGIERRETERQQNKTLEWLASLNTPQAQRALQYAQATGDVIGATKMALEPAPQAEIREVNGRIVSISPDGTVRELYGAAPAGFRQVTGAQLGLTGPDAEKLFNVSPEGQVTAIGGAGTTVNVDAGSGGKFEEAFAKGDAATIDAVYNSGLQAARNIGRINQLETLLSTAPSGAEGAIKLAAGEFGINTEGLSDIQAAEALINSLIPEQRQPGSGEMSNEDLALFKRSLPRIINQPGGNQVIIQTMRAIAEYDAQGAQIVQQLRAGEFGTGDAARAKAFQMLLERRNPLADFRVPAAAQGGNGSQPVVIDGVTIRKVN